MHIRVYAMERTRRRAPCLLMTDVKGKLRVIPDDWITRSYQRTLSQTLWESHVRYPCRPHGCVATTDGTHAGFVTFVWDSFFRLSCVFVVCHRCLKSIHTHRTNFPARTSSGTLRVRCTSEWSIHTNERRSSRGKSWWTVDACNLSVLSQIPRSRNIPESEIMINDGKHWLFV